MANIKCALGLVSGGLLIGIIIGLSRSPLLAAIITGVLGLASQFLVKKREGNAVPLTISRDEVMVAIFLVSLSCTAGIAIGITTRVNELLYFGPPNSRMHLIARGFSEEQVNSIMDRWAKQISPANSDTVHGVDLLTDEDRVTWKTIWELSDSFDDPAALLNFLRTEAPQEDQVAVEKLVSEAEDQGLSDREIISSIRTQFGANK